jgi:hypothetical protein
MSSFSLCSEDAVQTHTWNNDTVAGEKISVH